MNVRWFARFGAPEKEAVRPDSFECWHL
jgi:hypothetical protein